MLKWVNGWNSFENGTYTVQQKKHSFITHIIVYMLTLCIKLFVKKIVKWYVLHVKNLTKSIEN